MDEYANKRSGGGLGFSGRGSNLTLPDPNHDGKGTQYCNRLGCSTRLNSVKSTNIGSAEKPKISKTSLCTTSSKINAGNKTFSSPTDFRKSQQEKQVRTPLRNTAENSSRRRVAEGIKLSGEEVETEASEFIQPTTSKTALSKLEGPESPDLQVLSMVQTEAPTSKPQKQINRRLGSCSQDTQSSSSSIRRSVASGSTGQVTKPCSQYLGSGPPRYGVKNLNCSSISNVLPSGCSSSNLSNCRKVTSVRKRPSDDESSSSGGKSTSGSLISSLSAPSGSLSNSRKVTSVRKRPSDEESSSSGGKSTSGSSISSLSSSSGSLSNSRKVTSVRKRPSDEESSSSGGKSTSGSSISSLSSSSGSLMPQQAIRRAKIQPTSRDAPVSVRTQRVPVRESRKRLPEQQNDNSVSLSEPIIYPQQPESQLSILEPVSGSSSRSCPMEAPPVDHNSLGGQPSSIARSARSRPLSSHPANNSRHGPLGDRDGYRHFNMDGIAEQVLLALERIEQDDELTYEQLMVLETNLFLGGFSFHDQHRDMRLDIDNMTYEELLALEDKMGTVSTALSEELLSKCLKRSIYVPCSHFPGITACRDDDTKCSICQEEYVAGEEVGKLTCDHRYHVDCINQWLRKKNWCPICKTSVVSPSDERN